MSHTSDARAARLPSQVSVSTSESCFRFKRPTYSLRGLLLAVTLAAIFLAWSVAEFRYYAREHVAIDQLRNIGANVSTQTKCPKLLCALFGDGYFQQATGISFDPDAGRKLRDELLSPIGELRSVQTLEIDGAPVTDRVLTNLKNQVDLKTLILRRTKITGSGLVHVPFEKLRTLDLTESPVDDEAVKCIKDFRGALGLAGTDVTDKGLLQMQQLDLVGLDLDHTQVTDAGVQAFLRHPHERLRSLSVSNTFVSVECLQQYSGQVKMYGPPPPNDHSRMARRELELSGAQIISRHTLGPGWWVSFSETWTAKGGNRNLAALANLDGLDLVTFYGKTVDDTTVSLLPRLPTLPALSFNFTSVGDATLNHLSGLGLDSLTSLSLVDTNVTDVGLTHLAGLEQLRNIDLARTAVTDEGLKHLTALRQLQDLGLSKTSVSDTGLKQLYSLRVLEEVDLTGTQVTDVGVAELQAARPNLLIIRNQR